MNDATPEETNTGMTTKAAMPQAGPGLVALTLVVAVCLNLMASIYSFITVEGSPKLDQRFSGSFGNVGFYSLYLILAIVVLRLVDTNKVLSIDKKGLYLLVGVVGFTIFGLHVFTTLFDLTRASSQFVANNKVENFLINAGLLIMSLGVGMWGMSEAKES